MSKQINTDLIQILINPETPSNLIFAIKESFKTIRTNILLSFTTPQCKKLVITSSLSGEGKTTSTINIAIALSMIEKRVLLVDIDLRKRHVGKILKLHHNKGFSDIICGNNTFDEVVNKTKYPNLDILSAGTSVKNPSEIVASKLTEELFNSISNKYDFILFDAPPVNIVSDALPLIKKSDGVIFIVREELTTHKELKKALTALELIKANILGVVYIGTDSTEPYYAAKYSYGYGKYAKYSKYSKYSSYSKYESYRTADDNNKDTSQKK